VSQRGFSARLTSRNETPGRYTLYWQHAKSGEGIMPERIDGFIRPPSTQTNGRIGRQEEPASRQNPTASEAPQSGAPATDSVSLTESARRLSELSSEAAAGEAVDIGRVESVRQAIDEGVYEIDPRQIAERLLALDDNIGE
jgi:negative regulator of flagellin synthesis FlgM